MRHCGNDSSQGVRRSFTWHSWKKMVQWAMQVRVNQSSCNSNIYSGYTCQWYRCDIVDIFACGCNGNDKTPIKSSTLTKTKMNNLYKKWNQKKQLIIPKEITPIYIYSDKSDNNITTKCKFMLKKHISSPVKCISPKSHYKSVRGTTIPLRITSNGNIGRWFQSWG